MPICCMLKYYLYMPLLNTNIIHYRYNVSTINKQSRTFDFLLACPSSQIYSQYHFVSIIDLI